MYIPDSLANCYINNARAKFNVFNCNINSIPSHLETLIYANVLLENYDVTDFVRPNIIIKDNFTSSVTYD